MKRTILQRISILYLSLLMSCAASLESENIVGGYLAKENQFAYQISLERYGSHFCGGALIQADIVLTAAHCFVENGKVRQEPYTALAGTSDLKDGKGHRIRVTEVYVSDKFQKTPTGGFVNDIAVLKLAGKFDVTASSVIKTVTLPKSSENYADQIAKVSGYGWDHISIEKSDSTSKSTRTGSYDGKLKYAEVEILSECNVKQLNVICGRVIGYVKGLCNGDSGGPLVKNSTVIGVVSSGDKSCNESKKPTKYTNVSSYLPLIKGVIHNQLTSDTIVAIILPDFTRD